jgi:hypothetical protein
VKIAIVSDVHGLVERLDWPGILGNTEEVLWKQPRIPA